jgi:hypothetical protein
MRKANHRKLNMILPPKKKKYRYRSSITGLFVTEKFALKNKKTTEREVV